MTTEAPAKTEKESVSIGVSMPPEMRVALEDEAKRQNVGLTQLARRILAQAVNADVSVFERRTRTRVVHGTPEEAEAAKQKAAAERTALIASLMARYKNGEISIPESEIETRIATHTPRQRKSKTEAKTASK